MMTPERLARLREDFGGNSLISDIVRELLGEIDRLGKELADQRGLKEFAQEASQAIAEENQALRGALEDIKDAVNAHTRWVRSQVRGRVTRQAAEELLSAVNKHAALAHPRGGEKET